MVKLLNSRLERFAKLKKLAPPAASKSGYVYVSHMPEGFEEDALRKFFWQFGKVVKVKVSRSKKTGRSKGYAFVEFLEKDVAKIAAEAMHGFLIFGKQLVCRYLDEVSKFAMVPCKKHIESRYPAFKERYNAKEEKEVTKQRVQKLVENEEKLKEKLKELGVDYDFPGYSALLK
ncbi:unnamed protein product [Blepharisma stoltei]|uniref:RRM domain-containing protein n=1 Tax=Blepharisma stoltei TaxID=1481888 RepID=A0AAU9ILG8_9CILI|nr:unnamed protein product [Blepharisma stoltei]